MKYITEKELMQISVLVGTLNVTVGKSDIYLGNAPISDSNGDILGYVGVTDDGEYGFILSKDDE